MHLREHPTTEVRRHIQADPETVWTFVSDVTVPARFSDELTSARLEDPAGPVEVGTHFVGSNHSSRGFEWETNPVIVDLVVPARFVWRVGDELEPVATWSFEVVREPVGCTLIHRVVLGPGDSPLRRATEARPDRQDDIIDRRLSELGTSMTKVVDGIASLSEAD